MKPLLNYTKEGKTMSLLRREGDVAIFWDGLRDHEVIHIKKQQAGTREVPDKDRPGHRKTITLEAKELPPSTNEWGDLGFSHSTIEAASACFEREVAKAAAKSQPPI